MEYRCYPAPRVLAALRGSGCVDPEVRIFQVADHGGCHAYFFARKPDSDA